jgi:hypothetical protein
VARTFRLWLRHPFREKDRRRAILQGHGPGPYQPRATP